VLPEMFGGKKYVFHIITEKKNSFYKSHEQSQFMELGYCVKVPPYCLNLCLENVFHNK